MTLTIEQRTRKNGVKIYTILKNNIPSVQGNNYNKIIKIFKQLKNKQNEKL